MRERESFALILLLCVVPIYIYWGTARKLKLFKVAPSMAWTAILWSFLIQWFTYIYASPPNGGILSFGYDHGWAGLLAFIFFLNLIPATLCFGTGRGESYLYALGAALGGAMPCLGMAIGYFVYELLPIQIY